MIVTTIITILTIIALLSLLIRAVELFILDIFTALDTHIVFKANERWKEKLIICTNRLKRNRINVIQVKFIAYLYHESVKVMRAQYYLQNVCVATGLHSCWTGV